SINLCPKNVFCCPRRVRTVRTRATEGRYRSIMIRAEREARILSILNEVGIASIRDLASRLGRSSAVTVRRDVARLAERGALLRSHGGVARMPALAQP